MLYWPLFLPLGLAVGTLGTMIGVGGGFLLVPTLLFLMPDLSPGQVTAMSLFVVACNSLSGSIAYFFHRQIHLKSALLFSVSSLPGAWAGTQLITYMSQQHFELLFSALMAVMAGYLLFKKKLKNHAPGGSGPSTRTYALGSLVSFLVAFGATFLGVGGGIVHVPLMSEALGYPVHLAAGTSHFVLAVTSTIASIQHWRLGHVDLANPALLPMAAGVIFGAQLGAQISKRVPSSVILRVLGAALLMVAIRLAWRNF